MFIRRITKMKVTIMYNDSKMYLLSPSFTKNDSELEKAKIIFQTYHNADYGEA